MREKEMLAVVEALANQPTAPFHEDAVRSEIEKQLGRCPHVKFARDGFGNVIAHYQRGRGKLEWAFAAHMDHPGWVRGKDGEMTFLGSVPEPIQKQDRLAILRCGTCRRLRFGTGKSIPVLATIY
jgi:hypothetical protein